MKRPHTLSLDEKIFVAARRLAIKRKKTLSALIDELLEAAIRLEKFNAQARAAERVRSITEVTK